MKVIIKRPGENPSQEEIENTLEGWEKVIGCKRVESVTLENNVIMLCDEEGKLNNSKFNFYIPYDCIFGTVIFASFDGVEDLTDLTDSQIDYILRLL